MLTSRQQSLLKVIIDLYVKDAEPVSSGLLVNKISEPLSSATVRNELVILEEEGYLVQPHTSAGRIPSTKAYQFYVENFLNSKKMSKKIEERILSVLQESTIVNRDTLKMLAKEVARLTGEAVVVAFSGNDVYYTGLSNLIVKPEFEDKQLLVDISRVIDHLDKVVYDLFPLVDDVKIMIGANCAFNEHCAALVAPVRFQGETGMLVILGPERMDYIENFNLINFITTLK